MMKKLIVAVIAALAGVCVLADWDGKDAPTTLKHVSKVDGSYETSLTNAAKWARNPSATVDVVAPCLPGTGAANPAAADFDYYSATKIRTFKAGTDDKGVTYPKFSGEATWGGKSLHMGPGSDFQYAGAYPDQRVCISNLWFHENSKMSLNANVGFTNSTITIVSTVAVPFWFDINYGTSDNDPAFCRWQACTLKGDANAVIWMPTAPTNNLSHRCGMVLEFDGNGDEFRGTIKIGSIDYQTMSTNDYHQKLSAYKLRYGASMQNATFDLYVNGTIKNADAGTTAKVGTVNLRGGWFNSTAMVQAKTVNIYTNNVTTKFGSTLTAEKLNLYSAASIEIASDRAQTIGNLNVTDNTGAPKIKFSYNKTSHKMGAVHVTEKFVGPVTLELDANFSDDALNYTPVPIFTVAKSAFDGPLTADAFTLVKTDGKAGHLPRTVLVVEDDTANDRWNVKLAVTPYVTSVLDGRDDPEVFAKGEYWSDNLPPHKDADYFITNKWYSTDGACDFSAVMRSLTLCPSGGFTPFAATTTFPDEMVMIGGTIQKASSVDNSKNTFCCKTDEGSLEIPAEKTVAIMPYGAGDVTLAFDMPLTGAGTVIIKNRGMAKPDTEDVNYGSGVAVFNKPSPNFKGKIDVTKQAEGLSYPYTLKESLKFGIAEPESIGGTLDVFTADALRLSYYGTLKPLKSMTLAEDSNRGIFVDWAGRVLVEDDLVFNVNNKLKIAGSWEKFGNGTLFLGASTKPEVTATTVNNAEAKAMTERNVIQVTEGAFGASTKVAAEGLAVKFAAGAMLAADANWTGDAAKYGLYNKTGSVSFDGDALKVRILPPTEVVDEKTVAILTVPTAQKGTFEGNLVAEPMSGYWVTFDNPVDNDDETTTFKATLTFTGLTVTENCSMDGTKLTLELDISDDLKVSTLTVELKQGDVVKKTVDVTPLAVGKPEVVFDGLSKGDYTYQIKLTGTYKGEEFTREEEPVAVSLAAPAPVTPKDGKFVLSANAEVDLANTAAGPYAVSSATGKKCHLKWTDANGKYAVMSGGTLEVKEGTPKNGLTSYESYVLGLNPTVASDTTYIITAKNDNDPEHLTLTMPKVSPRPESETGVAVSYTVQTSSDRSFSSDVTTGATTNENSFKADLPTTEGKVRYYRVQIDMK